MEHIVRGRDLLRKSLVEIKGKKFSKFWAKTKITHLLLQSFPKALFKEAEITQPNSNLSSLAYAPTLPHPALSPPLYWGKLDNYFSSCLLWLCRMTKDFLWRPLKILQGKCRGVLELLEATFLSGKPLSPTAAVSERILKSEYDLWLQLMTSVPINWYATALSALLGMRASSPSEMEPSVKSLQRESA